MNTIEQVAQPGAGNMPIMSDSAATPAPQHEPPELRPTLPPRKRTWPAVVWLCAPFAALLLWWKFAAVQPLFFAALPYTQAVAFAAVGVVGLLYRDKYTHPIAARAALSMFIMFGMLMALNTYRERAASGQDKKRIAEDFEGVNGRIDGMKKDVGDRVDKANISVGTLTSEFTDFKDKVRPNELKTEMASLRESMDKILHPPKADLGFTFIPFLNPPVTDRREMVPLKQISRTMDENRVVTFDITGLNYSTDVTAVNVDLTLMICDACTFAKEPNGFEKVKGSRESIRYRHVPVINARTSLPEVTLDVVVPPHVTSIQVGYDYRCAVCISTKGGDVGTVMIRNPR